jgi:hypothetical protein
LPDPVVEAVVYYRRPALCGNKTFASLTAVHAADVFAYETNGSDTGIPEPGVDEVYLREIGCLERVPAWRGECLPRGPA